MYLAKRIFDIKIDQSHLLFIFLFEYKVIQFPPAPTIIVDFIPGTKDLKIHENLLNLCIFAIALTRDILSSKGLKMYSLH